MSDSRRILDRQSEASALARDLVSSARDDQPAAGAKARARAQLERTLGGDGITTHISSLSAAMADLKLAAPVLVPTPLAPAVSLEQSATRASRAWVLYASIAAAGIIAAGGVGIALVLRSPSPQQTTAVQSAPPPPTPNTTAAAGPTPTPVPPPTPAVPSGPLVAVNTETPSPAAGGGAVEPGHERSGASTASGGSRGARERTSGSSGGGGGGGSNPRAGGGGGGATASSGSGSCAQRCRGNIDCLLRCGTASPAGSGGGGGGHFAGGGGGSGAAAGGPEAPSRGDVMSAMSAVRGAVQGCGQGRTGTATVSITFASSGRVTSASVAPPFAGTPAGSCIARNVRSASVPRFTRPSFTVNYPFVIH